MPARDATILIVDDQAAIREELVYALEFDGFRCREACDGDHALEAVAAGGIACVLLDIKMPGRDGMQVLGELHATWPSLPVIMISGHGDIGTAVLAVKNGAYDFLAKPFDTDRVLVSINNALRLGSLTDENTALREELAANIRLLGDSPAIEAVRALIHKTAPTEAQVLITGENGTGKELVARQLHALSRRCRGRFVPLNCAAIPADLIESEMFGHAKGAFTGATKARRGHVETADGGTLFLDEVGDMSVNAQAKLLRVLQERTVQPIGSSEQRAVDIRILAATNQDLAAMVEDKTFREDLYYRLHVIRIDVPPLRARSGDIALLAQHFVQAACQHNSLQPRSLTDAALEQLQRMPFPGNVRELKNLIEAAAILSDERTIGPEVIDLASASTARAPAGEDMFGLETITEFRANSEREFIRRKLQENGGNIKRTAERIQIQRSNLYKKLDRYGLK